MQLERAICRDIDLCREVASLEGCVAHLIASHACQMAVARDHLRQVAAAPDCVEGSGPLVSEAARRAWAIREAELREEIDEAAATIRCGSKLLRATDTQTWAGSAAQVRLDNSRRRRVPCAAVPPTGASKRTWLPVWRRRARGTRPSRRWPKSSRRDK